MAGLQVSEGSSDGVKAVRMPEIKITKKEKMLKIRFLQPVYTGDTENLKGNVTDRDVAFLDSSNMAHYGDIKEFPEEKARKYLEMKTKKNVFKSSTWVTDPNDPRLFSEMPVAILVEE